MNESSFYVGGPIRESRKQGKFHGEYGSRQNAIQEIRIWCDQYLGGGTRELTQSSGKVYGVNGAEKIGKSSTIYAALDQSQLAANVLTLRVAVDDPGKALTGAIAELISSFNWTEQEKRLLLKQFQDAIEGKGTSVRLHCFHNCLLILREKGLLPKLIVILELHDLHMDKLVTGALNAIHEAGALVLMEMPLNSGMGAHPRSSVNKGIAHAKVSAYGASIPAGAVTIAPLTVGEAQLLPCGKDGVGPSYCYFRRKATNGYLPRSPYCSALREIIVNQVGCHPMLLERTCIELEKWKEKVEHPDQVQRMALETFVRFCLEEIRSDGNDIDTVIDAMIGHLDERLHNRFMLWALKEEQPPEEICEQLKDRGLAFRQDTKWIMPQWIKERAREGSRERDPGDAIEPDGIQVYRTTIQISTVVALSLWPGINESSKDVNILYSEWAQAVNRLIKRVWSSNNVDRNELGENDNMRREQVNREITSIANKDLSTVQRASDIWGQLTEWLENEFFISLDELEKLIGVVTALSKDWAVSGRTSRHDLVVHFVKWLKPHANKAKVLEVVLKKLNLGSVKQQV